MLDHTNSRPPVVTTTRMEADHPGVIVIEFVQGNTWDEIYAAFAHESSLAGAHSGPVGVIMDIRNSPDPPDNTTLAKARRLFANQPRNVKIWVLCGGSRMSIVIANILRNSRLVNMHFAATLEEAVALIERHLESAVM